MSDDQPVYGTDNDVPVLGIRSLEPEQHTRCFYSCDLDLYLMTVIYKFDPTVLNIYRMHTKNELHR